MSVTAQLFLAPPTQEVETKHKALEVVIAGSSSVYPSCSCYTSSLSNRRCNSAKKINNTWEIFHCVTIVLRDIIRRLSTARNNH